MIVLIFFGTITLLTKPRIPQTTNNTPQTPPLQTGKKGRFLEAKQQLSNTVPFKLSLIVLTLSTRDNMRNPSDNIQASRHPPDAPQMTQIYPLIHEVGFDLMTQLYW